MKILFITPCYEPAIAFGGTTTALTQICTSIVSQGQEVHVYTTNSNGHLGEMDVPINTPVNMEGVQVNYFRCNLGAERAFYSKNLIAHLKKNVKQFDLIYISAIWQWIGVQAAKICAQANQPYLIAPHGSFAKDLRKKSSIIKNAYFHLFLKKYLKKATAIHLTVNREKSDAKGWLDYNNQNMIIPNIIKPENYYFVPDSRQKICTELGIPINAKILITVSRPNWKKRVDLLIEGIAKLKNHYLIYAGETKDPIVDQWKKVAKENEMNGRFICTGLLQREKLLEAYSAADLFCLISENENFGMVVGEAMLCGLPVLISQTVGISEILENEFGVGVVKTNDPSEIQVGIESMISTVEKTKDREPIRQIAINKFSPKMVGKSYVNSFKKILE